MQPKCFRKRQTLIIVYSTCMFPTRNVSTKSPLPINNEGKQNKIIMNRSYYYYSWVVRVRQQLFSLRHIYRYIKALFFFFSYHFLRSDRTRNLIVNFKVRHGFQVHNNSIAYIYMIIMSIGLHKLEILHISISLKRAFG